MIDDPDPDGPFPGLIGDSGNAKMARPAMLEDLKTVLGAFHKEKVDYLLIGGFALFALEYQRGTVDIDLLLPSTLEQSIRAQRALMLLPDKAAKDLEPGWFAERRVRKDQAFVGFGREPEDGDQAWRQQQELSAHGENPGSAAGLIQCVVEDTRIVQRERPVVQPRAIRCRREKETSSSKPTC